MSLKYEVLKRLVKASGLKKRWVGLSTEELLEGRRRQNAKNRIPALKDDAFTISRIEVMGCPVLKLDEKDVAIPAQYMKMAVEVMRHGDDSVPDYMLWLQRADFTGCPPVTLIYGTDETLYACAPAIEAALQKSGVNYERILGEGLFHCYPVFPIVKEAREGWRQMVERMIRWRDET